MKNEKSVVNALTKAHLEIPLASKIAVNEGVLDTYGHVSMRHPNNPHRYFLSRSSAPDMVTLDGLIEYHLNSRPVRDPGVAQYSERVIHGEIYKARPDVMSICHHHAPAFMPLLATGTDYVPVFHLGAVGGIKPPFWDQRDEFGDTIMLVIKAEEGASLARTLGSHQMVLMRRHGVTVVGSSVRDCIYRAIQTSRNADFLVRAMMIGSVSPLSPDETELAGSIPNKTTGLIRSWDYWTARVAKTDGLPSVSARPPTGSKRQRVAAKIARRGKKRSKRGRT